jgi:DNA-binding LytR/AlgR family response regulator
MSPIEILVLSKDINFVDVIKKTIKSLGYSFEVVSCATLTQLMNHVHESIPAMVVSEMQLSEGFTGVNVAQQLISFDIPILFVSEDDNDSTFRSVQQYFPAAYLVKPIPNGILKYTIALVLQKYTEAIIDVPSPVLDEAQIIDDVIFVRSNNLLSKILVADILYISTEGNYSIMHAQDKRHVVKVSLTNMKDIFGAKSFFQVHRSYLVNLDKIDTVNLGSNELMVAGQVVPIGRKDKDELLNALVILK